MSSKKLRTIGLIISVMVFFWATWPMWHWLFFDLLYLHMIGILVALILLGLALWCLGESLSDYRFKWQPFWGALGCIVLYIVYLSVGTHIYTTTLAYSFEPEIVASMPQTEEIRYLPYEVALTLAQSKQQEPKNWRYRPDNNRR